MLLTLQKDQSYNDFTNNFHTFSSPLQYFQQNLTTTQSSVNQYQHFQQTTRSIQQQSLESLNIRPRRRRACHSLASTMDPVAVARRNERERNRVKQVNDGFNELRKKIPYIPEKKKFSKVEILRFAMMYIKELQTIIDEDGTNGDKMSDLSSTSNDGESEQGSFTDSFFE